MRRMAWIVSVFLLAWCGVAAAEGPIDIGVRRELFVDAHVIGSIGGDARLEVQQPRPGNVAVVTDKPWEGNTCAYYTVFADTDKNGKPILRMYYRGSHYDTEKRKQTHRTVTCYAESRDGIHWTKPALGLFEFEGSRQNNIVWDGAGSHCFTPFKDTNPSCPPDARYKALAQVHRTGRPHYAVKGEMTVFAYKSPDGFRWTMSDGPLITFGDFDSQNTAFWDSHAGVYREYHRVRALKKEDGDVVIGGAPAYGGYRSIMMGTSKNFLNWASWSRPRLLEYSDKLGDQHLYTNAVMPCPRAPHILIGFPTRLLPEEGHRVEPILMASRDGRRFHRWNLPVVPEDAPEDRKGNRSNYLAWGVVPTPGNDREYSVYASESYLSGPDSRLRRFTYRVDGFVAFRGGEKGGHLVTKPLRAGSGQLEINYAARPGGSVRIEIQDAAGKPLKNFTAELCDPLKGDEISQVVRWNGDGEGPFTHEPVRIRFEVQNADLYSFRFKKR